APVEIILSSEQKEKDGEEFSHFTVCTVHDDLSLPSKDPQNLDKKSAVCSRDQESVVRGEHIEKKFTSSTESAKRLLSYARHMQGEDILKTILNFEEREYENRLQLGPD